MMPLPVQIEESLPRIVRAVRSFSQQGAFHDQTE